MPSPQRYLRRDFRYPLHLPVLIRMAQRKDMRARSENISLGGILLSSSFQIPEGSNVEVSVGVDHMQDPGILLNARQSPASAAERNRRLRCCDQTGGRVQTSALARLPAEVERKDAARIKNEINHSRHAAKQSRASLVH